MPLHSQIHEVAYDPEHADNLEELNANLFAFGEICSIIFSPRMSTQSFNTLIDCLHFFIRYSTSKLGA